MAVAAGRLAGEYFLRGSQNYFIDLDVMLTGRAVTELSGWFDLYWNSTAVYPVQAIVRATGHAPATRRPRPRWIAQSSTK